MEPIIIKKVKNGKKNCAFYSDRLTVEKKGLTHTVYYDEIREITYNPKFGIVDAWKLFNPGALWSYYPASYCPRAFLILLKKYKEELRGCNIRLKLSNEDFEKIKNLFPFDIEVV